MVETITFILAAAFALAGAFGVVLSRHPVHSALSLVGTLFGVAVLFLLLQAEFLAAVQVIVYAGAIVVLILYVIMLLGVDKLENLETDPLPGQRPLAAVTMVIGLGLLLVALFVSGSDRITGASAQGGQIGGREDNVANLAVSLFSDYVFAFELTSVLLIIAVVATVLLARKPPKGMDTEDESDSDEREVEGSRR
jgi:NADH-quinone oxidoreductase subunit J